MTVFRSRLRLSVDYSADIIVCLGSYCAYHTGLSSVALSLRMVNFRTSWRGLHQLSLPLALMYDCFVSVWMPRLTFMANCLFTVEKTRSRAMPSKPTHTPAIPPQQPSTLSYLLVLPTALSQLLLLCHRQRSLFLIQLPTVK